MGLMAPAASNAQIAVSANDGKVMLVDGVNTPRPDPQPDTVTILDLTSTPPKILGEVRAPTSVAGPPHSVAIAPDRSLALVTASARIDPANPRAAIPDDRVSVIDLTARPPQVVKTLEAGRGASGVSINRAGNLALVANRNEGTISIFAISGKNVTPVGKVDLGAPESSPSQVMFLADGRRLWFREMPSRITECLSSLSAVRRWNIRGRISSPAYNRMEWISPLQAISQSLQTSAWERPEGATR